MVEWYYHYTFMNRQMGQLRGVMANETVDSLDAKPVYRTVKTSRLFEQIVQQVEDSILKGQLKPGDQLPAERDLAQRFGVSRTAVREAVKTLREKGLVEAYSGRGTFVTNGTSQAIRQSLDLMIRINQQEGSANLAELRLVLEPEIAGLAASRIEEQLLSTMRESVAVMDRNLREPDAYVEADLDFHLALAEAAGNPLILSLLDRLSVSYANSAAAFSMCKEDRRGGSSITSESWRPSSSGIRRRREKRCVP